MTNVNDVKGAWIVWDYNDGVSVYSMHETAEEAVIGLTTLGYGRIAFLPNNTPLQIGIDWWAQLCVDAESNGGDPIRVRRTDDGFTWAEQLLLGTKQERTPTVIHLEGLRGRPFCGRRPSDGRLDVLNMTAQADNVTCKVCIAKALGISQRLHTHFSDPVGSPLCWEGRLLDGSFLTNPKREIVNCSLCLELAPGRGVE